MYAYANQGQIPDLRDPDDALKLKETDRHRSLIPNRVIDSYLSMACENFTVLGNAIQYHGRRPLIDYLDAVQPHKSTAFQTKDDLLDTIRSKVESHLGEKTAQQAAVDIDQMPMVLTANHHGVTYFAQDFQGNLIFALNRIGSDAGPKTIPVLSCGTVPLDNLTFPLGLLCYHTEAKDFQAAPAKVPIFSNKLRRQMVCCAQPFSTDMIARAKQRAKKLIAEGQISATLDAAIHSLLENEYNHARVLDLDSYSHQSVVLNSRIWNLIFREKRWVPELINLELETIAIALLEIDLQNQNSLAYSVMFDKELRENVFLNLDGKRACWQTKHLLGRLHADCSEANGVGSVAGCGTMLFWGLDERKRRIPLYLRREDSGKEVLCGMDDRGKVHEMPYSVTSILDGLQKENLLPSLFTSFLTISLARGVVCLGGYFQCEYLPAMQAGLVKALSQTGGYGDVASKVSEVKTDTYLSGMIAVMRQVEGRHSVPAGPIEIIAGGGLDDEAIGQMQSLTVRDAHIGALAETIQDLPWEVKAGLAPNWRSEIAAEAEPVLREKVALV